MGFISTKSPKNIKSFIQSLNGTLTIFPPLFSFYPKVVLKSPTTILLSQNPNPLNGIREYQQSTCFGYTYGMYTLIMVNISPIYKWVRIFINQLCVCWKEFKCRKLLFHNMQSPLEDPQALMDFTSQYFQSILHLIRDSSSSNLFSWSRFFCLIQIHYFFYFNPSSYTPIVPRDDFIIYWHFCGYHFKMG